MQSALEAGNFNGTNSSSFCRFNGKGGIKVKVSIIIRAAVLLLIVATLQGCIWWVEEDGYRRGDSRGGERGGERGGGPPGRHNGHR